MPDFSLMTLIYPVWYLVKYRITLCIDMSLAFEELSRAKRRTPILRWKPRESPIWKKVKNYISTFASTMNNKLWLTTLSLSPWCELLPTMNWSESFSRISAETTAKAFLMECVPHTASSMRVFFIILTRKEDDEETNGYVAICSFLILPCISQTEFLRVQA